MKRFLQFGAGLIVLLAAGAAFVLIAPTTNPDGEESARWFEEGQFKVVEMPFETKDLSRATSANGTFPGAPDRVLAGRIWRPENGGSRSPLVLYSHGFMSSHAEGEYLGQFLATHGYVTVAVDYPLTNGSAPGGPLVVDVINQPADASFVLDTLLARNNLKDDALYQQIDPDRIAAVGLSLGGLTTELIAFHQRLGDNRIKVAASIAGPRANFTADFFQTRDLPFLMLAGELDAIVPYAENALPILQKAPDAILVSLASASHTGFAAMAAGPMRFVNHPDEMVCGMLMANLGNSGGRPMFETDAEAGIVSESNSVPCAMTDFARAMRPPEQLTYMRLVIFSFLESVIALTPERRAQAATFLKQQLPAENPAVNVML